jgi:YidC/Oxa1 family membrane protein insertase
MFKEIFNQTLYQPLLNSLAFLTNIMPAHDIGLAIVTLTFIVRVLMYPITHHSTKTQNKMRELEPELSAIKEKLKDSKEEQARQTMELYGKHGVNPFSGCLVAVIQIPVFIALYYVFARGLNFDQELLYSFIAKPENMRMEFLGLIPMAKASTLFAVLAGITQFLQVKLSQPPVTATDKSKKEGDFARAMKLQMTYVLPFVIGFAALKFPAAVSLYWTANNVFAIVHEGTVRIKAAKFKVL